MGIPIGNVDMTGLQAFPVRDQFIPGIPPLGLAAYWRDTLQTFNGSDVASWEGYTPRRTGYTQKIASQSDPAKQPAYASGVVTGDGATQYLETNFNQVAEGMNAGAYMVMKIVPGTVNTGSARYFMGAQESSSARAVLGCGSTGLLQGIIGNRTLTATGFPVSGVPEVIGLYLDGAGSCALRRGGVEVGTNTYTGGTADLDMMLLVRNFGGSASGFNDWGFVQGAVYIKGAEFTGTTGELDAIDAAITAA